MNIIEVKNNLVKLCYENELTLSSFVLIKDTNNSYIAQVLHLEATRIGKVAIAKIVFNYNNGISAYDGSIPSLRAELQVADTKILLETLDKDDPLNLGRLATGKEHITVNVDILKDNPIICAEKFFTTKVLLNNIALQLQARKEKIVVIDTAGIFKTNKLTVTKDFKLPLNNSTINYIYEKGFEDATAESKSMIQAIFEELSEYSKTVEFIPFDTFKAVVDAEFMRTKLMQLVVLKNKIKQIRDWNVFAQCEKDFDTLKEKLVRENTVVIDISCLKESLQKECIKYIYTVLQGIDAEFYTFTPLTNENSDKFLLKQFLETENVYTTTICGYDYNYLSELKKRSKNMLMFTPLKQQNDFGGYNIFLQKLAEDEFIAYGKMTKFVPLIGKLQQLNSSEIYYPKVNETLQKLADEVTIASQSVISTNIEESIPTETPVAPQSEVSISELFDENKNEETPQEEMDDTSFAAMFGPSENEEEDDDDDFEKEEEIIPTEVPVMIDETPTEAISEEIPAEPSQEPIITEETVEETAEPIVQEEITVAENAQETPTEAVNEVEEALNSVPELEDDEELSDDDLDMIEELSKPDEEIPVINDDIPVPQEMEEPVIEEPLEEEISIEPTPETVVTEEAEEIPIQEEATEPVMTADEEIENATMPTATPEPLQTRANTTPVVPVYPSDIPEEDKVASDSLQQGDRVMHEEFGEGVVEKMMNYGDKLLCSVNFTSVGRRLLNPEISEMKKI